MVIIDMLIYMINGYFLMGLKAIECGASKQDKNTCVQEPGSRNR